MLKDCGIENVKEDFKKAEKVEQYRLGELALYVPEGLRWSYLPLAEIRKAEESFRVISAGHCVPVRERRPEIDLIHREGKLHLPLEKRESMEKILRAIGTREA